MFNLKLSGIAKRDQPLGASRLPLRFLVTFASCFLFGIGVLLTPPVQAVDAQISKELVKVSHGAIVLCRGKAQLEGAVLRDPASGFAVEMKDGCNAVNVTLLLWSAVLAFPASWRMKALGMLLGSLIIQALNIVRFVSLFYLGQYSMRWFDFAHAYLWESLLILDTIVIFGLWVSRGVRAESR